MVPGDSPLIDIGYKYNVWKVLNFIVTDSAGITSTGIPNLSKYPDQFTNVAICPVARPLVMSKINPLLIKLNPTTNQYSLIWHWSSCGLLSVVGCGYVHQLRRE